MATAGSSQPAVQAASNGTDRCGLNAFSCERSPPISHLVNLLDCRTTGTTRCRAIKATTRHASLWHATTSGSLVDLHHDRVHDSFQLLLLPLELVLLGQLIFVQPVQCLLDCSLDLLFVPCLELLLKLLLLQSVAHGEAIVLQAVLRFDLGLVGLVFFAELLSFRYHAVNLSLRQAPLLVRDRDLVGLPSRFVLCRDIQNPIGIDVKCHFNLGNTTGCRRNSIEVELAQQVVVLRHCTLALEYLNEDTWLVVGIRRESLALLRRDGGVALNQLRHHTTGSFQTHRQGRHVQKQQILDLRRAFTCEDGGLHCSTKGNCFVGVDGPVGLLAIEELLNHGLDLRDSSGSTDKNHLVHIALVNATVAQALFHRTHRIPEVIHVELLEASSRKGARIVDSLEQAIYFNGGLC